MTNKQSILHGEGFFPSEKRWLFYRYWCHSLPRGEIIAIHGAAEHSGRYVKLGQFFANAGYNFYTFDLRGHGRSEGRRGFISQYEDYLVDIANFYAFLRQHKKMKNPVVLGHSLGGLFTILFTALGQCFVKGIILSAPLLKMTKPVPLWKRTLIHLLAIVWPSRMTSIPVDPKILSHDPQVVEDYIQDPFVTDKVTVRWLSKIFSAMKFAIESAPSIQTPMLIIHGEQDKICDQQASRTFAAQSKSAQKELYLIRGGYHEVLNEIGAEEIAKKVLMWLDRAKFD